MESRWFQREVVSEPSSAELVYSLLLTKVGTANAGPVAVERYWKVALSDGVSGEGIMTSPRRLFELPHVPSSATVSVNP